jgi:hypothetical protein
MNVPRDVRQQSVVMGPVGLDQESLCWLGVAEIYVTR